jgi:replication-associated recombination protein RarA
MNATTRRVIVAAYEDIEAADPDISTERLLQMTADRASEQLGREFDVSHVVEALEEDARANALAADDGA